MESTPNPIPTESQLQPVPAGVEYNEEHAQAIEKGHIKLGKFGAACIIAAGLNAADLLSGNLIALTNHAEPVPLTAVADAAYTSQDPISDEAAATHGKIYQEGDRREHQTHPFTEFGQEDPDKWYDVTKALQEEPEPMDPASMPHLPEDFPTIKLPIAITAETPKDALQKQLISK